MNLSVINRAMEKAAKRALSRAELAQQIAKDEHRNAPRGGENLNRFGEQRSAPGEPPAMETGTLFAHLDQDLQATGKGGRAPVNYRVLEFGYSVGARSRISDRKSLSGATLEPRPLGAITLARLRREVK